ncbi:ABC transporter substrate-binding protein [Endozoicomonas arenosclerae]|uniref:ABC transporter substrate-binding protein n=1 Tax=Endozoicomonas arenosclerae TaxID=1633495 RepID=UPI000781A673|nr:extracellular solute-binding protein [Endozoicomonas arenosclerae]
MKTLKKCLVAASVGLSVAVTSFSAAADVTLKLWTWREQEKPLWEEVSKRLEGVDIKVEVTDAQQYNSRLNVALQNGGPDLFQGRPRASFLDQYVEAGIVKPIPGSVDLSGLAQGVMNAGQASDGKTYGVPFAVQTIQILYNKKLFRELGIKEPTNQAEFTEAMKKLKAAGKVPLDIAGRAGWSLAMLNAALEAGFLGDDLDTIANRKDPFTSDKYVAMLEAFESWKPYINSAASGQDYGGMRVNVALGEAGMIIDGLWSTSQASTIRQTDPEAEIGLMPVPGPAGKVYAFADGAYLVNAKSANVDAANKVLAYTASKEFGQLFADLVGELTTYKSGISYKSEYQQQAAEFIAKNGQEYLTWKGPINVAYEEVVGPNFQAFIAGKINAKQLAQKIETGFKSKGL